MVQAGRDYAAGSTTMIPINPQWDNQLLDILESGRLAEFDCVDRRVDGSTGRRLGPRGAHLDSCVRLACGQRPLRVTTRFYEAIPEWIAGFAVATAGSR